METNTDPKADPMCTAFSKIVYCINHEKGQLQYKADPMCTAFSKIVYCINHENGQLQYKANPMCTAFSKIVYCINHENGQLQYKGDCGKFRFDASLYVGERLFFLRPNHNRVGRLNYQKTNARKRVRGKGSKRIENTGF